MQNTNFFVFNKYPHNSLAPTSLNWQHPPRRTKGDTSNLERLIPSNAAWGDAVCLSFKVLANFIKFYQPQILVVCSANHVNCIWIRAVIEKGISWIAKFGEFKRTTKNILQRWWVIWIQVIQIFIVRAPLVDFRRVLFEFCLNILDKPFWHES